MFWSWQYWLSMATHESAGFDLTSLYRQRLIRPCTVCSATLALRYLAEGKDGGTLRHDDNCGALEKNREDSRQTWVDSRAGNEGPET